MEFVTFHHQNMSETEKVCWLTLIITSITFFDLEKVCTFPGVHIQICHKLIQEYYDQLCCILTYIWFKQAWHRTSLYLLCLFFKISLYRTSLKTNQTSILHYKLPWSRWWDHLQLSPLILNYQPFWTQSLQLYRIILLISQFIGKPLNN